MYSNRPVTNSTEGKEEVPSRVRTLLDARNYDVVEQTRISTAAQFDPATVRTKAEESGGKGEGVYVNESLNGSEEQARSALEEGVVSMPMNEGANSWQMNECANGSTR